MILSGGAEKAFDKTQYPFMIKVLKKLGIEGMFINIKVVYDKPREQLKLFPLKSGMRQGCLLSPLLFNILLEFLARTVRQEQEITGIHMGKKEIKLYLFADDMILYLRNPKNSTTKLLEMTNFFSAK
jgi:hypothetical protein